MSTRIEKFPEFFFCCDAVCGVSVAGQIEIPEVSLPSSGAELLFPFVIIDTLKATGIADCHRGILAVLSVRRLSQITYSVVHAVGIPVIDLIRFSPELHLPDNSVSAGIARSDYYENILVGYASSALASKPGIPNPLQMKRGLPTRGREVTYGSFLPIQNAHFSIMLEALVQIFLLWQIAGSLHVPHLDCWSEAARSVTRARRFVPNNQPLETSQ